MNAVAKLVEVENFLDVKPIPGDLPAISVIGLGYVGAVSTACLADLGHQVVGCDVDEKKAGQIAEGRSPIHEAGLSDLLETGVGDDLITATTDTADAVARTDMTFVSVGTPTSEDGGCDFRYIVSSAQAIGEGLRRKAGSYHVVVMRCSIPPATTLDIMVPEIEKASGLSMGEDFGVCFNPEFLREGTAIDDFRLPPKTVIGENDEKAAAMLARIYEPVDANPIITSIKVAEMVKYVDNVWHAAKVSFANEVGRICKPLSIDSHKVMDIFVQDTKLNLSPYYLKPGFAYGGSCLPKEVRAVTHLAEALGVRTPLICSLSATNKLQVKEAINLVRKTEAKRIGFLGLAFKPGTDYLRESPVLEVVNAFVSEETEIRAYDPAIRADTRIDSQFDYVRHVCPHLQNTVNALPEILCPTGYEVLDNSDVVIVSQSTDEIRALVASRLGRVKIIDLARLFEDVPGFANYEGIGW